MREDAPDRGSPSQCGARDARKPDAGIKRRARWDQAGRGTSVLAGALLRHRVVVGDRFFVWRRFFIRNRIFARIRVGRNLMLIERRHLVLQGESDHHTCALCGLIEQDQCRWLALATRIELSRRRAGQLFPCKTVAIDRHPQAVKLAQRSCVYAVACCCFGLNCLSLMRNLLRRSPIR